MTVTLWGASRHQGDYVPFAFNAGVNGSRTDLMTLSWPMSFYSPLQGCFRLGVEITRGGTGAPRPWSSPMWWSIAITWRMTKANVGIGLLGHLTGGYPTGLPCKAQCPFPEDPNPPFPNPQQPGSGRRWVVQHNLFSFAATLPAQCAALGPSARVMIGGVQLQQSG